MGYRSTLTLTALALSAGLALPGALPAAMATSTSTTAADAVPGRDAANWARMEKFLADNKKKDGVTELKSGIQWRTIKKGPGTGANPTLESTVTVRYRGTLIDGTLFDETEAGSPPAEFPLNRLIKGWQEVIPLMKAGDKVEIVIPSELAYGSSGKGDIKPDQVLVFEIELVSFK